MAKSEIKHPDKRVDTGAYSAAVEVDGWVFVSGQVPIDMKTGETIKGDIAVQTQATLEHIRRILEEAGCGMNDVVKCTCHLARIEDFSRFNEVYAHVACRSRRVSRRDRAALSPAPFESDRGAPW